MTLPNDKPAVDQQLLEPVAPHDAFTFDELEKSYNFRNVSRREILFVRLIRNELAGREGPVRLLDIGCGTGITTGDNRLTLLKLATEKADEVWGVEPDESVAHNHEIFTHFQHALLEDADLPESYFDVAYSFMVMEHVEHPDLFLAKVKRVLKPGGVYLFVTPNGHHYFTKIAGTLKKIRLDELVLRVLRGKTVEDYHYPVQYRCNKFPDIHLHASKAGFSKSQIATAEITGPKPYLPGPLRPVLWLAMKKRDVIRNPKLLLNLYARLES